MTSKHAKQVQLDSPSKPTIVDQDLQLETLHKR